VGAFVFGRPFLTSAFGHPVVPLLGELPLATAALFDLGVYITVVGATLLTLSVLGASQQGKERGAVQPAHDLDGIPGRHRHRLRHRLRHLPAAARAQLPVVLGLSLLGYAVNVFIFAMGRLWSNAPPILVGRGPWPTRCRRRWC
jgi:hypothetical protein